MKLLNKDDYKEVNFSLSSHKRIRGNLLVLFIAIIICFWQLGSTGLVDETPPLFAAAARAMSDTGDWLTPRVNGLNRFDKPPLVYWVMGLGYSLPSQSWWDPLGTWSARFPSAIATLLMMLGLSDTVMKYPQPDDARPRRTALIAALAFGLSPLVMIWSRIAVSDALLCGTLGITLLLLWRRYANPAQEPWSTPWIVLGFAVLTKGPVAIALVVITLALFSYSLKDLKTIIERLKPFKGMFLTALISLPWYLIELKVEGKPFWDSFFGYHNFQRFTSVVNSHSEPWWFFGVILVVASIPFTPFLVLGLIRSLKESLQIRNIEKIKAHNSLNLFASSWLIAVLVLFTFAATKLPSYWLPAVPAAAIIIGHGDLSFARGRPSKGEFIAYTISIAVITLLAIICWLSPHWLLYIDDPEIPLFGQELIANGIVIRAAICLTFSAIIGLALLIYFSRGSLLEMQVPLIILHLIFLVPTFGVVDRLRQLPLRNIATLINASQDKRYSEPIVMVGVQKPSIHYYTKQVIVYVGRSPYAFLNISDRLNNEERQGWKGSPIDGPEGSPTALIIIDRNTLERQHWKGLNPQVLGEYGIYSLWRVDRKLIEDRAKTLTSAGFFPTWRDPRPERY